MVSNAHPKGCGYRKLRPIRTKEERSSTEPGEKRARAKDQHHPESARVTSVRGNERCASSRIARLSMVVAVCRWYGSVWGAISADRPYRDTQAGTVMSRLARARSKVRDMLVATAKHRERTATMVRQRLWTTKRDLGRRRWK